MSSHQFTFFPGSSDPNVSSKIYYIAFLVLALVVLLHLSIFFKFTVDDAYITFAYSRNLALGDGLRIALGNPVEANSSFLWSVVLAPGILLGIDLDLFATIIGLVCACGVLFFVFILTKRYNADSQSDLLSFQFALIAIFLTGCNSSFALWTMYGMENGFVALLLLASFCQFNKEVENKSGFSSALLIIALYMSRPEAFGYVIVFIAARFVFTFVYKDANNKWFYSWLFLLISLICCYELWGWFYYGHLLPTSAVAKVGTSIASRVMDGLHYTLFGGHASVLVLGGLLLFFIRLPALIRKYAEQKQVIFRSGLIASLLLMHLVFVIAAGGDWMPNARFWSQVVPLGAFFLVTEMSHFLLFKRLSVLVLALTIYGGLQIFADKHFMGKVVKLDQAQQRALKGMADFLNSRYQPGDVVAASDIGLLTYHYKGKVLDWWGLADEKIGRSTEAAGGITPQTILERKPNYIVLYSNEPTLTSNSTKTDVATYSNRFITNSEFTQHYKQIFNLYFWDNRYHTVFALQ